ncbi:MAG: hypothetical protein ABII89_05500 [Candidatus Omnitrophota bacterium]
MKEYQKWCWIELAGFDNQKRDLGVKEYLANAGFVPSLVSLLLSSTDFVLQHDAARKDVSLPPDVCSYGGRLPLGEGKKRQVWSKRDLKRLVAELHKHGIKVYPSVFDIFLGNAFHDEWVSKHREVLATARNGEQLHSINPLARFKDGSYFEDFFVKKLMEVIRDYDFDGFHCADGLNHGRFTLYWAYYSDDMVGQFTEKTGVKLPEDISGKCDGNKARSEKRADWIWRNRRVAWIKFFTGRWEEYCRKIVNAVHREKKQVSFNTSWSRDPFEAIYRYGVDYRKIADAGMDWFIQECPGVGNEFGGEGRVYPGFFYKVMATILLTKASMPDANMVALNHIHDVNENYEMLRHAPTFLEKEIYTYPNLFHLDSKNRFQRCIEGFLVCLADGINREEWNWLQYNWNNSFAVNPRSIAGPTLVWSDNAMENQLEDFIKTRSAGTHSILYRLLAKGAPIYSAVNVDSVNNAPGPLLVINHQHFPQEELKKILACKNGPVIIIGKKKNLPPNPDFQFEDVYPPDRLIMAVYGLKGLTKNLQVEIVREGKEKIPADMAGVEEPPIYCLDLYSRKISDSFLTGCVKVISRLVAGAKVVNNVPAKVLAMEQSKGAVRLFIGNDEYGYAHPEIDMGKKIRSIKTVTKFPYRPVAFHGSKFTVRVPGKGVAVLDLTLDN